LVSWFVAETATAEAAETAEAADATTADATAAAGGGGGEGTGGEEKQDAVTAVTGTTSGRDSEAETSKENETANALLALRRAFAAVVWHGHMEKDAMAAGDWASDYYEGGGGHSGHKGDKGDMGDTGDMGDMGDTVPPASAQLLLRLWRRLKGGIEGPMEAAAEAAAAAAAAASDGGEGGEGGEGGGKSGGGAGEEGGASGDVEGKGTDEEEALPAGSWACHACTSINTKPLAPVCEVCGTVRPMEGASEAGKGAKGGKGDDFDPKTKKRPGAMKWNEKKAHNFKFTYAKEMDLDGGEGAGGGVIAGPCSKSKGVIYADTLIDASDSGVYYFEVRME
jgi:hypothetical protein